METRMRELERRVACGDPEAERALERERVRLMAPMTIIIDGETYTVEDVTGASDERVYLETEEGASFVIFESSEAAGIAARARWQEMAEYDPNELREIVGTEALVAWGLGRLYAVGTVAVRSLQEWLDLHLDHPEEEWASYDGEEREIERVSSDLACEIGFEAGVAYRT